MDLLRIDRQIYRVLMDAGVKRCLSKHTHSVYSLIHIYIVVSQEIASIGAFGIYKTTWQERRCQGSVEIDVGTAGATSLPRSIAHKCKH